MKKIIAALLFTWFPAIVFADGIAPPPGDLSVSYLATIFGVVDGVLHGTGSQIIGTMLGSFNAAVLVMASVILSYALFISILNTAHQGEFLGQKYSSIWVPLRMVAGVSFLLPKASGYSFIQILVMWVVVQGVGAADKVWDTALDYMNRNGTVVEPLRSLAKGDKTADNTFLVAKTAEMLKSEVCMYTLYNGLVSKYKVADSGVSVPYFSSTLRVTGKSASGASTGKVIDYSKDVGGVIDFPGPLEGSFKKYEGVCGSVSWGFINNKPDADQVANPANLTANDSASIGIQSMVLQLGPLAQNIANQLAPPDATTPPIVTLDPNSPLFVANALVYNASDYFAIVKPALRELAAQANHNLKDFIKDAKETGWLLAGSYYYNMVKLNQSLNQINDLSVVKDQITADFKPKYTDSAFQDIDPVILANLQRAVPASSAGVIDAYAKAEKDRANAQGDQHNQLFPNTGGGTGVDSGNWLHKFLALIFESLQDFRDKLQAALNSGQDPILTLAGIGNNLIAWVEGVWVGLFALLAGLGAVNIALAFASGFWTPAVAITTMEVILAVLGLFLPLLTFWMMINLSLGATLAYYVPLIPFILFLFGTVTWLAVVLESIIAAPLVALGITHPEGHDLLGKAEQAVMLLTSVFLRPVLMIFGFIFGISLSFVALSLLNQGLAIALRFMADFSGDFLQVVSMTTLFIIYTGLVLALINRSFSMIYEVPNKVLRWVGGHPENTPEEGMLNQIRGNVDQGMRELGQVGTNSVQAIQKSGQDIVQGAKAQRKENEKSQAKGISVSPAEDQN